MNATMKVGKDYIDFYNGNHTFYEMSLINVRPDNLDEWCNHMAQKNWFTQQMAVDFRKALLSGLISKTLNLTETNNQSARTRRREDE